MAGALAFNVLVALIPLVILGAGLTGFILSARFESPTEAVIGLVTRALPDAGVDLRGLLEALTRGVVEQRRGFTLLGAFFFVWLSTRLVGSLRTVVREVFDIGARRGIIAGKLFDIAAVLVGLVLVTLNLGATVVIMAAKDFGVMLLGLTGRTLTLTDRFVGFSVSFLSIWTLFLIAFRFLPPRRIPWRTVLVAASFAAVGHELLKLGFSWYATEVADYGTTFGNLATVAVLVFWIYYGALVFILGGEVAQVSTMRKATRAGVVSFEGGV